MGSQTYVCENKQQCLSGGSFESGDEEWYNDHGYDELPKRCKPCRENEIRRTQTYECENTHCIGGGFFVAAPKEVFIKNGWDIPTRCKPCEAKGIRNTQTYVCRNAGCTGDRSFEEKPKKHWDDLGRDLPANCPKCKEWAEEQKRLGKITLSCFVCGGDRTFTAERRISYHRKDGKWDASAAGINMGRPCTLCEENPYGMRLARERLAEWRYASFVRYGDTGDDRIDKAQREGEKSGFLNAATAFDVPTDPNISKALITPPKDVARFGKNELEHFMQERHGLKALGTKDPNVLLRICGALAQATDPTNIIQCRSDRNILKADIETGLVVILTQDRAPQGHWRIRTAYFEDNLAKYVEVNVKSGRFKRYDA